MVKSQIQLPVYHSGCHSRRISVRAPRQSFIGGHPAPFHLASPHRLGLARLGDLMRPSCLHTCHTLQRFIIRMPPGRRPASRTLPGRRSRHMRCRGGPAWAGAVRFLITDQVSGTTPSAYDRSPNGRASWFGHGRRALPAGAWQRPVHPPIPSGRRKDSQFLDGTAPYRGKS